MNVTIFGSGYVGLVTGACFAEMGNQVVCVDVDAAKIAELQQGEVSIFEPGLQPMVRANLEAGRLRFTTEAEDGLDHGEVLIIAVGTPSSEDGSADVGHVLGVAETIGRHLTRPAVIVDKSTVPVGTADRVRACIAAFLGERGLEIGFSVLANPEFLKEGTAVADFMKPDRVIIGSDDPSAAKLLERLYAPFGRNRDKIVHMDVRSAEMTKYAANVMLATRISLMNELANLADHLGADVEAVRQGIGTDPRIGYQFIFPGCGYGGSCFPKDVRALVRMGAEVGFDTEITRGVEAVNERQKRILVDKINAYFDNDLGGRTLALWGLAFKPNTGDMREATSRTVIDACLAAGASIQAYDPQARDEARRLYDGSLEVTVCDNRDDALVGADALVIVTEWNEFRSPDFHVVGSLLNHRVIFDGRNLYDPAVLAQNGFRYVAIGRGNALRGDQETSDRAHGRA